MSAWNTERWAGLLDGTGCPMCGDGRPLGVIAELETSFLTSTPDGPMRGYACVVAKAHVVELFDLTEADAAAFMRDLRLASRAVAHAVAPVKMNYEIHGNTLPHLHAHLFPRFRGDPFEGGPIDPKSIEASPYADGEFATFVNAVRASLDEA